MLRPVFVKANLGIRVSEQELDFPQTNVSAFGVTGLPWGELHPDRQFGRTVEARMKLLVPKPETIRTSAVLLREQSIYSDYMGLRFVLTDEDAGRLRALVKRYGIYPTEYVRKYPRIPADPTIQTFPMHVMARPLVETEDADVMPAVFQVKNLSPNGILIASENQSVLAVSPGLKLEIVLDPRGWFPVSVEVEGLVCRVMDDVSPDTGNIVRHLGIKFTRVDDVNRAAFLDLLKDILGNLKK